MCMYVLCSEFVNRQSCSLRSPHFSKLRQVFYFSAYIFNIFSYYIFIKTAELHSVVTVPNHFSNLFLEISNLLLLQYRIQLIPNLSWRAVTYYASTQNIFLTLNILNVCYTLHWAIKFDLLCPLKGL